jgi:hypothetical protein
MSTDIFRISEKDFRLAGLSPAAPDAAGKGQRRLRRLERRSRFHFGNARRLRNSSGLFSRVN